MKRNDIISDTLVHIFNMRDNDQNYADSFCNIKIIKTFIIIHEADYNIKSKKILAIHVII